MPRPTPDPIEASRVRRTCDESALTFETTDELEPLPGMLGQMTSVLADREINVIDLINKSRDDIAYNLIDMAAEPDAGLLQAIAELLKATRLAGTFP